MAYKQAEVRKNKLFSAEELSEMRGLANIMQTAKRAGQFAENPPTGNRLTQLALSSPTAAAGYIGGAALAAETAAKTAVPIMLVRFLTGTEAGKRLMLSASKVSPDSPQMQAIVNAAYRHIQKAPITAATGGN